MLGSSPAIRGNPSAVPDTTSPATAPSAVQNVVDKVRSDLEKKTGKKFPVFAASLYIKKSKEYVVKVALYYFIVAKNIKLFTPSSVLFLILPIL